MCLSLCKHATHAHAVPFGKHAFFPGELRHTNELTVVTDGADHHVECTAFEALGSLRQQMAAVEKEVEAAESEVAVLRARLEAMSSEIPLLIGERPAAQGGEASRDEGEESLFEIRQSLEESEAMLKSALPPAAEQRTAESKRSVPSAGEDEELNRLFARMEEMQRLEEDQEAEERIAAAVEASSAKPAPTLKKGFFDTKKRVGGGGASREGSGSTSRDRVPEGAESGKTEPSVGVALPVKKGFLVSTTVYNGGGGSQQTLQKAKEMAASASPVSAPLRQNPLQPRGGECSGQPAAVSLKVEETDEGLAVSFPPEADRHQEPAASSSGATAPVAVGQRSPQPEGSSRDPSSLVSSDSTLEQRIAFPGQVVERSGAAGKDVPPPRQMKAGASSDAAPKRVSKFKTERMR